MGYKGETNEASILNMKTFICEIMLYSFSCWLLFSAFLKKQSIVICKYAMNI